MRNAPIVALVLATLVHAQQAGLQEPLDARDPRWTGAEPIADGWRGGAARFDGKSAHLDVGPCPISSREPFTLRVAIRTTTATFCTPLMARAGDAVGLSLVLGRTPGTISFEAWSWQRVRIPSLGRIDDGRWHQVEVSYHPATTTALLFVDGELQGSAELGHGEAPNATLRLGDNVGAHQPFAGDLDELELLRSATHAELAAALAPVLPLAERQAALRAVRDRAVPKVTPSLAAAAADAWPGRRAAVRAHAADALGLVPPPASALLDVQVHGELRRSGVLLQRLSWIGFPGHRATGWLWLPDPLPKGPLPAVLCPHGHWENGARHPVVQARCAAFAQFGWLALAVDSVHVEHVASGVNAIGAMTWHNQRALDVLLARPEVDPARIGCTGASGGGQQTYYLMALEDRLAAAAPMVMACYLAEILDDTSAHCDCNHAPRLAAATDVPELCAVFAPRPAMFGSVSGDWTHNFPREGLPELRAHWARRHGPEPRSRHADEGHNYDRPMREAVYAFLHDVLVGPAADGAPRVRVEEPPFVPFSLAELAPPLQARPNVALDANAMAKEHLARRPRVTTWTALAPGLAAAPMPAEWHWEEARTEGWRRGSLSAEVPIPVRLRQVDDAASDDVPFLVVIDPRGSAAVLASPAEWLAAATQPVLVDPRPYGEWAPFRAAWQRNGIFLGRGEAYQAAADIAAVCHNLPGKAPVHVVGLGEAGVVALLAATLCPRIERLVTDDLGPNYAAAGNRLPLAPELLRFGDLPDLIAALPDSCSYVLGGAASTPAGKPARLLRPAMSRAELAALLRESRR